jgi:amidase
MTEYWRHSATDLAGLIRRRDISAREATADALARLDAVNPRINAVIAYDPAEACPSPSR